MRKLLLSFIVLASTSLTSVSQVTDQEIGLISSILKSEIKVFFAQNIELKTSEADLFWEIYDAYEAELKPLSNERIDLLKRIMQKGDNLTAEELDKKINALYKSQKKRIALRMKYYKTYKKKISPKVATQFYQIDGYIYTHVSASLNEGLPLIIPKEN